jgi:hypothetical protein
MNHANDEALRRIGGGWGVFYGLSFLGTFVSLGANLYFSEIALAKTMECLKSQHSLGGYSGYSSYDMCEMSAEHELAKLASVAVWVCLFFLILAAACWLGSAFGALPKRLQKIGSRQVNPASAGAALFLPFFNLYVMFAVPLAICRGIKELAEGARAPQRAPAVLAIVAGVCTLIPITWPIAPILWIVFMGMTERAVRGLVEAGVGALPAGGQGFPLGGALASSGPPRVRVLGPDGAEHIGVALGSSQGHVQVSFPNGSTTWIPETHVRPL